MPDAYQYCERLVREADKDRFLATLFAPSHDRPALFSLYAFDLEIGQVAGRVKEPLAGEIRLQWWHDAVSGAIPEQVAGNPVASAFVETLKSFQLPLQAALDMIETERLRLYGERSEGGDRKSAGLLSLAARILNDGRDPKIDDLVRDAGGAAALLDQDRGELSADTRAAMRSYLDRAREQLASVPDAVLPAFLPLALIRARLDLIDRQGDPSAELPQWRKQWMLWRASKNLRAWL